jgi:hypothetical protein
MAWALDRHAVDRRDRAAGDSDDDDAAADADDDDDAAADAAAAAAMAHRNACEVAHDAHDTMYLSRRSHLMR